MLLEDLQLNEMAKPVKLCDKCGKQMSKFHYWYKGGWKCKSEKQKDPKETPAREIDVPKRAPKQGAPAKKQWAFVFRDKIKAGEKVKGLND